MDPKTGHSDDPTQTAFNVAFNTKDNFWTWVSKPGNEYHNTRFIMAMKSISKLDREETILQGEKVYSKPSSPLLDLGQGSHGVSCQTERKSSMWAETSDPYLWS